MGCDVHVCLEEGGYGNAPGEESSRWEPLMLSGAAWSGRNYRLFSWLAGVRNTSKGDEGYIEPISEPRGLPKDCSKVVREHLRERADHSHTWLLASEILSQPVIPEYAQRFCIWLTGVLNDRHTWLGMNTGTPPKHVRLVMGFDN